MKKYGENELASLVPQGQRIAANGEGPSYVPLQGSPLYVLTLEELREVFDAGMKRFSWEELGASWEQNNPPPDFNAYLQSKGINIIP